MQSCSNILSADSMSKRLDLSINLFFKNVFYNKLYLVTCIYYNTW